MKIHDIFPSIMMEGYEDDLEHSKTLQQTGFWGKAGSGCIIMAKDTGRFLIAHRSKDVEQPGTFGGWGGAIDSGEDPAEAVKREVHEETGYTGAITIEPMYVFKKDTFRYYNFLVIVDKEFKPRLDWENQGFKWCEYGSWPKPLHFGLQALFKDPASVATMQKALEQVKKKPIQNEGTKVSAMADNVLAALRGTFGSKKHSNRIPPSAMDSYNKHAINALIKRGAIEPVYDGEGELTHYRFKNSPPPA